MSTTPEHPQDESRGGPPPPPPGPTPPPGPGTPAPGYGPGAGAGGYGSGGGPGSGYGSGGGFAPGGAYGPGGDYGRGGGPGPYPPTAYGPGAPLSPSDQRTWAVLSHALTLLVGFIAPLVVWLVFKGRGAFSEHHSKESLNFQITMMLAGVALSIVTVVTLGLAAILFFPLVVFVIVFVIIAAVKASQGEPYRYPLTLRLIS